MPPGIVLLPPGTVLLPPGIVLVVPPGTVSVVANRCPPYQLLINLQRPAAHDGDFKVGDDGNNRLVLRFSCVANGPFAALVT